MKQACLHPPGLSSRVHTGYILSPSYSLEQEPSAAGCCVHTDAAVKHHQCLQSPHSPNLFDLKEGRANFLTALCDYFLALLLWLSRYKMDATVTPAEQTSLTSLKKESSYTP